MMTCPPDAGTAARNEARPPAVPRRPALDAGWMLVWFLLLVTPLELAGQESLPPGLQELFAQGVESLKAGKSRDAERAFLQVLEQQGKAAFVHNNLGMAYQQQGKHDKAIEQFEEALRMQPDYAAPQALMGTSLLAVGRVAEATKHLERAVELKPKEPEVRLQLAVAYERSGNFLGMTDQFRVLRESMPKDPEYAYQLGKAYVRLMAWSVQQMLEIEPRSARVYQALGENYLAEGKLDFAERALSRAVELDAKLPGLHWSLAQVYLQKGETAEARKQLDAELAVVPGSVMALGLKKKLESGTSGSP